MEHATPPMSIASPMKRVLARHRQHSGGIFRRAFRNVPGTSADPGRALHAEKEFLAALNGITAKSPFRHMITRVATAENRERS